VTLLCAAAWLTGCGCTIFSNSSGCNIATGGAAIALAPAIVISRLGENARNRKEQDDQRHLILSGDLNAIGRCVLFCADYSTLRDRSDLIERSVDQVIASWDAAPAADQLPVLMEAHAIKARNLAQVDPTQAEQHWRRVAELSADTRITSALQSKQYGAYGYNTSYYDHIAIEAQQSLMVMYYNGIPGHAPDHSMFSGACKPVAAWPPAWMLAAGDGTHNLNLACDLAYYMVFGTFSHKY
jgi:hypothetical protein